MIFRSQYGWNPLAAYGGQGRMAQHEYLQSRLEKDKNYRLARVTLMSGPNDIFVRSAGYFLHQVESAAG